MAVLRRVPVATLGVPCSGRSRELDRALVAYLSGHFPAADLQAAARAIRQASWIEQRERGVTRIPSNDFSYADRVLDTAVMVGAIPERFGWTGGSVPLHTYFAMARDGGPPPLGDIASVPGGRPYVPQLCANQQFILASTRPVDHFLEARTLGIHTRPVLLGPVSFLKAAAQSLAGVEALALLPQLVRVYQDLLTRLERAGADWVQIDEPALADDLAPAERLAVLDAYTALADAAPALRIMLAVFGGGLGTNLETACALPVAGLHLDLVAAPRELSQVARRIRAGTVLSLGLVDGSSAWRSNLPALLEQIKPVVAGWPLGRIELAPSRPLTGLPVDLNTEDDGCGWHAGAVQKMDELTILARALGEGRDTVAAELRASAMAAAARARDAARNPGQARHIGQGRDTSPVFDRPASEAAE